MVLAVLVPSEISVAVTVALPAVLSVTLNVLVPATSGALDGRAALASLVVMPVLARAKRRVAARLESRALAADSRQTDLCAWLSAILLGGLGLNALWGWWWADPVAALVMVPIIVREGVQALRGETCDDCH